MEKLENKKLMNILKWIFIVVSVIHLIYATVTMRGMYEDGAFFMMDLMNNFSNGEYHIATDFEGHTRFFMSLLMQLPLFFFHKFCCLNNKTALMMLYTFTQFVLPLLALWWNYKLTKRTGRVDILFWSLFAYSAILITFSIFSVVEILIGGILHFILWNYLAAKMDYTKKDIAAIIFLLVVMAGTYEYVIFLGPVFFMAAIFYTLEEKDSKRSMVKSFIGLGALAVSIFDVVFMLHAPDEAGEIGRFFKEMYDFFPFILELNSLISIATAILLIFYLFKKSKITAFSTGLICFIYFCIFLRLLNTPLSSVYPMWEQHFRSIPCWAFPLIFFGIYIFDLTKKEINYTKISNLICIVLICGITQTCWQMVNTYYWNKNIQYMKSELKKTDGLLYIPSEHEEMSGFHNQQLRRYIWHGVFTATSIVFSDTYKQKTLLLNYDEQQDEGNNNCRSRLYVPQDESGLISIPYGMLVSIKNDFWDLTDCAIALDKYNKEHNIQTDR